MLTLDTLSNELLEQIFGLVHDTSGHTLLSLSLVNRTVSEVALPLVFRELFFDLSATTYERTYDRLAHLSSLSSVRKGTRKITVKSGPVRWGDSFLPLSLDHSFIHPSPYTPSEIAVQKRWKPVVEFISQIESIHDFVFECQERIPPILLNALEKYNPSCRLHIRNWTRLDNTMVFGDPYEEALARSPLLRSIHGSVNWDYRQLYEAALMRIIALAPKVEAVSYTNYFGGGCVDVYVSPEEEAEIEREKVKFKSGYGKGRKRGLKGLRWSGLNVGVLRELELIFDLEDVRSLDAVDVDNIDWMNNYGTFSGVHHLSLDLPKSPRNGPTWTAALDNFLSSRPRLESLSIRHYHGYLNLPSILSYHGKTLRSLSLHDAEPDRSVLTSADLGLIRTEAPYLEHLYLDINRAATDTDEIYRIISSFPALRNLTISYDLGLHHQYFTEYWFERSDHSSEKARFLATYSKIDRRFSGEVWQAVSNPHLETITIYAGDSERVLGWPEDWHYQEISRRQVVTIKRNERDDLRDNVSALIIDGIR